jgi:murein DD-endopeptidase MepM/ murein hydrolase activator NlpD
MNVRRGSILALVCAVTLAVVIPLLFAVDDATANCDTTTAAAAAPPPSTGSTKLKGRFGDWNQVQVRNAAAILAQGRKQKVPARGWVIALATAMQESRLKNLANRNVPRSLHLPHDGVGQNYDSVGVFQQRPLPPDGAGGWGTVPELMTVRTAAAKFYAKLVRQRGWQKRPLTEAAQLVQNSAYGSAYSKWEDDAKRLAAALLGLPNLAAVGGEGPEAPCGTAALGDVPVSRHGWVAPMKAPLTSKFGKRWGRLHAGLDLSGPRGTAIRAAAAGKVIYAGCSPSTGNCDVDGSIATPGYGWHVEIMHQGHVVTRYAHMVRRPEVHAGQSVKAGQVIGFEGMSGNSTGVHLHFEVHVRVADGGPVNNANAIDPAPFMRHRGVVLGKTG